MNRVNNSNIVQRIHNDPNEGPNNQNDLQSVWNLDNPSKPWHPTSLKIRKEKKQTKKQKQKTIQHVWLFSNVPEVN